MKIVYIGTPDRLASAFIERMTQEGNDVFLISDEPLSKEQERSAKHRFYRTPKKGKELNLLLRSIAPACIVFAGNNQTGESTTEDADANITLLAQVLQAAVDERIPKFILLSSTSVYDGDLETANELSTRDAQSENGLRFLLQEDLVDIYRQRYGLDATILRASDVFSDTASEGDRDILSRAYAAAKHPDGQQRDEVYQPLHAFDLVDAIKRAIDADNQGVYNVSGLETITANQLYQLICEAEGLPAREDQWVGPVISRPYVDSSRIREELGWGDLRDIVDQIQSRSTTFDDSAKKRARAGKPQKKLVSGGIRHFLENIVIFAIFFALDYFTVSHGLFSQVDWLLVYVVLISIGYSMYQSALAAGLATVAYFFIQGINPLAFASFYSYAENLLVLVKYVFFGLVISYTANSLREAFRNKSEELEVLQEEYEDLKSINEENVLIKNEYEKRLLTADSGLPKLYSLVKRLLVQEPGRILMETMLVISELIGTDNVAVYQGQPGSPWFRLIGALNDDSAMEGKTWNISTSPRVQEAVEKGELFQGAVGSGEPSIVMPIPCNDTMEALVLIKSLPYESESLYNINLLKTLALLLRDSMDKALRDEDLRRDALYIEGTEILRPDAFIERVILAQEKAENHLADYCLISLSFQGSAIDVARKIGHTLRATDDMGMDAEGRLFILLNNTDPDHITPIRMRLLEYGVDSSLVKIQLNEG